MKWIPSLLLILLLAVLPWKTRAETQPLPEEVSQVTLADAVLTQENEVLQIQLADGQSFELETVPDREKMKVALGLKLPDKVKEKILEKGGSIAEEDPLRAYESLPTEQQAQFRKLRLLFLTNAARIFNQTRFVFGAGSLVGDAFRFVKTKAVRVIGRSSPDPIEKAGRDFSQRSHEAVQNILRGLDYKLWSQAPLVIDSNEFGLSVSVGLLAETGLLRRGGGGAEEIGLSLAYNKEGRAFVFEIFHNSENFDNTRMATWVLGVVGKAGVTMARRHGGEILKGSSYYPPAVPGFSTTSPEFFAAGFSSSLGLPPPPLADLMTFTNKFARNSLIRVTVSPVVKGYVRIQIGNPGTSMKLVLLRFVDAYQAIAQKIQKVGAARSCQALFN